MATTVRAALSVLMLIGFYVLALAIVVGLGVLSVMAFQRGSSGVAGAKLGFFAIAVAIALVVALWQVARAKSEPVKGLRLSPQQAPELWHMVRELAAVAQTRMPDEIILIPIVNAAVSEDTKLLGLIGGRRRLYIGVPLLQAMSVAQLRSVLAHELGHYSGRHTQLGAIAYRGRAAILATVGQLSGNVVGWVLKQYAKLYLLVAAAVNRRQELEADELSVQVAGRAVAQHTLRELPVIEAAWNFYEGRYIDPGWEAGYAPTPADFFGGFSGLLRARTDELAELRREPPPAEQSKWDSHPSIAARVLAMDRMQDTFVPADTRYATDLVPMFDRAAEAVAAMTVQFDGRTQLPWEQFTAVAVLVQEQRNADLVYRAAARLTGGGEAGLGTVFQLVHEGRLGELAAEFFPDATRREAAQRFVAPMTLLLRVAAVRSNVAYWRHSWTERAELVRNDGRPLDLRPLAELAVSPQTLGEAASQLAALGVDVRAAVQVDRVATAHGGDIIGGLANVSVNGKPHDVLILDNGLIMQSCPKSTDGGKDRLIAWGRSAPVSELAAKSWFLPYEEIATARLVKNTPIRVDLTLHDGRTVAVHEAWTGDRLARDSDDALRAAITPYLPENAGAR
ncbi:M48 family metalloprotease [Luedemannella helvata]|uniref:Peptidase M48 domain-containing protein n=1 Tax=Luedemannella helvata TaxID=349315 RepID=A0ABP4VVU4_9ACTN